jgi:succinate dehydrogenase / fumarate reductase membrane anchor subunit
MAHKGSSHFKWERATSVVLVPLSLFFVFELVSLVGADYQTVRQSLAAPAVWLAMLAFLLVGAWHMWLGMQAIIDDYVRGGARSALHLLSAVFSVAVTLAGLCAIYELSFGA